MADIAIITGATGGIGMEFVKAIHPSEDIDDLCKINCRVPSMLISIRVTSLSIIMPTTLSRMPKKWRKPVSIINYITLITTIS